MFILNDTNIILCFYLIALVIFYYITWRIYGIDRSPFSKVPLYEAPAVSPNLLRYLKNQTFDIRHILTVIMSLAIKGYISLEKNSLRLLKSEPFNILPPEEMILINILKSTNGNFDLNYYNLQSLRNKLARINKRLLRDYIQPNRTLILLGNSSTFFVLSLLFFRDPNMPLNGLTSILLTVLAIQFFIYVFRTGIIIDKDRSQRIRLLTLLSLIIIVSFLTATLYIISSAVFFDNLSNFIIVLLPFLHIFYATSIPQYTVSGKNEMIKISGYIMYLETIFRERLRTLSQGHFSKDDLQHLSYAIAIGIDTKESMELNITLEEILGKSQN